MENFSRPWSEKDMITEAGSERCYIAGSEDERKMLQPKNLGNLSKLKRQENGLSFKVPKKKPSLADTSQAGVTLILPNETHVRILTS